MKKAFVLFSAILLIITGCEDEKGYYISGSVDGLEDGKKVFISELKGETGRPETIDTAVVKDGAFQFDLENRDAPVLSFLQFEGVNGNMIFIAENEKLKFDIYKDSIRSSTVKGGKENKALFEYMDYLQELNRKMGKNRQEMRVAIAQRDTARLKTLRETQNQLVDNDKNFKEELFSRNKDSYMSVMLLSDMLKLKSHSSAEIREMYAEVSDRIKQTEWAKGLQANLEKMKAAEIGSKAPAFTAPTPNGDELSLSENLGKVTVVDFWAAWCKPCRVENPNLVKTYNKYKDEGLNIISVSLDRPGQKDRWLQAIEEDNIGQWDHVSNLEHWQDPIAKQYGINAIPATFVLDENGIIVAKNLRGDALADKIEELLN